MDSRATNRGAAAAAFLLAFVGGWFSLALGIVAADQHIAWLQTLTGMVAIASLLAFLLPIVGRFRRPWPTVGVILGVFAVLMMLASLALY